MNDELRKLLESRLKSDGAIQKDLGLTILAACDGREALETYLADGKPAERTATKSQRRMRTAAYLQSIAVEGFRGIGPKQTIELTPGPGLTLVVGRNGSGKSSFAEALEVLFTSGSKRWDGRPKIWKDGWRSLHQPHPTTIEANLLLDGSGPAKITTSWDENAGFEDQKTVVQPRGKPKTTLEALGWAGALESCRPFLSYNELGSMLDEGPSKLYDALAAILGLEDLVEAQDALSGARTDRQRAWTLANQVAGELATGLGRLLEQGHDDRVKGCHDALSGRKWDLDAIEDLLTATAIPPDDRDVVVLARAAALDAPSAERVHRAAAALREAAEKLQAVAGSDADRSRKLAQLLDTALKFHESHAGKDCPVCGTPGAIGASWAEATKAEISRLRMFASESESAHTAAEAARRQARELLSPPPQLLDQLFEIGIEGLDATREAWKAWSEGASLADLTERAAHLEAQHESLAAAMAMLKQNVAKELQQREDRWKPIASTLAEWLPSARRAVSAKTEQARIKAAEDWLKDAVAHIRNERFAPIAEQALAMWTHLRQNSNVELGKIELEGTKGRRRVNLDVTVDGVAGAALGVMSQGELHSLALSLFLPRATLAESPFRFVVIDDPVQSMDPARVDGLARALQEVARTRQVLVFTHDERLPDAVRRLEIDATILGVTRRPKSVVEVRTALDPVRAHIEDALALTAASDLPIDVLRRLVPGFCRSAVEASCMRVIRRKWLNAGKPHAEVEDALRNATKLTTLAALAFFDDGKRGGEVLPRLDKQVGRWAADTFRELNEGAHTGTQANLRVLIDDAERLAQHFLAVRG